ncbi:E3 ubiquitin-protein ligase Trim36 isoform X2 [Strongylocentrotus purpuratus]|nr:E3 ubiquitin-protein ligase Trim36 isoform X2 [Strongylocentrotus purpuratus]XP_030842441.1 E3 ubiquitin-protein ligase Trim36 isoform X2 [Strongylocentrotus purpuratus]XP_030842442.1 E3 ubiquitin-protein ligase Trim36 isoform X2 [Strongylocentrotus purpuratus]XP_030842443.1 E3 ubiquitin-protein ligase Trim36 isoform X2 [Strongylocentrotus purpuratus]XP_030842444.1 E3 ubiquitin-protein ligase Trim36 isoform X2 [Strongylocentrotus purpuratus]
MMANNMEHLERELICPLCSDYFTTPLLLPCNHNVCHRCAKAQLTGNSGRCSFHASSESLQSTDTNQETTTPTSSRPSSAAANRKARKPSLTSLSSTPTSPLDTPGGGFNTATRSSMRRSFRERKSVTGSGPITPRDKVRTKSKKPGTPGTQSPRPESPISESPRPGSPRGDVLAGPPETPRGRKGSTGSVTSMGSRSDSFSGTLGMRGRTSSTGRLNGTTATSIRCPTCDEEVSLGEKGINGLFRNFALEVVVDRYKLAAKKAASIPCGSCKKRPPEDAAKSCLDCKSPYCTECFATYHPWGTPRAQHVCIGPTYNYRPKTLMCNDHHGEKITMYCEGCHKPICHRCKFSGAHADHKVSIIERKYASMKEKMEQTILAIAKRRQNISGQVAKLEKISSSIEEHSDAMQKALAEALELLQTTLSEKHNVLTQRASEEVTRRTQNIRKVLDTYKEVLQGCSVADLASELLKETDKAMFVQAAKPLVGRLVQTARSLKQTEEMSDNYETFGDFTLDSTAALKSLQELDFTKAPGKPVLQPKSSNRCTCLEWTPSADGGAVASYSLEYIKLDPKQTTDEGIERPTSLPLNNASDDQDESENDENWTTISGLTECQYEQSNLEMNSSYKIRVKAVNPAGTKSSECILLKTPPAPVLPFKWIQCQSSVAHTSSKIRKDGQEVLVSPTSTLFSSNSSSFPTSPIALEPVHFVGDKKLTMGKNYWEVQVDKSTLAIHVGIASERMAERFSRSNGGDAIADRDSGHDSSDELDDEVSLQDPTVFVTHCMGKLTLPSPTSSPKKNSSRAPLKASSPRSCNIESNVIGVLLDAEAGKVSFYDGSSKECLFSRKIKVTGVIQPAISIIGSGTARIN